MAARRRWRERGDNCVFIMRFFPAGEPAGFFCLVILRFFGLFRKKCRFEDKISHYTYPKIHYTARCKHAIC